MAKGSVLYLIQGRDVSGAEIMHGPVIRADPEALVACPPGSPAEEFARGLGATTVPLSHRELRHSAGPLEAIRSVGRGLGAALELRRLLRRHPERRLLYCTGIRAGMIASVAAVGLRRRLLWCAADLMPPPPLAQAVRALARVGAGRVLCLSEAIAGDLTGRSSRLARITAVVYPGVDPEEFDRSTAEPGAPCAAIVGQISPTKRTDLAVEIAREVAREVPEFELRIVGRAQFRDEDFALETRLRDQVDSDRSLTRSVRFAGYRADVAEALAGCGMLLHCRPDEPFGIVLIEAMALGLPVVAPAAAGPLEIVEDGSTGLLYPPGDADAAAACIRRLIGDRELAAGMGAAARARVEERFTLARQLDATRRLLEEVGG